MEIETAARKQVLASPTVQGYVAGKVFKFRLEEKVDGTGGRAVVVGRNNGWATPDPVTTQEYPILTVKCFADPTRNEDGTIRALDAEEKAWAVYRAVNRLFHNKRAVRWGQTQDNGGLFVVTSQLWREPSVVTQHDLHGHPSADPLGDTVYVYAEYAVQVLHAGSPSADLNGGGPSSEIEDVFDGGLVDSVQGRILLRGGTTAEWEATNPVLKYREVGLEYTPGGTVLMKAGDGSTAWDDLDYVGSGGGVTPQELQNHIDALEPHPAYDVDMPSMTLIFENHLI